MDIQTNRDAEILRLLRGEIDFINQLDAEYFDKVSAQNPALTHDAGVSLDSEQMWFNQVANAPLPDYKKAWFRSTSFRRAVSESINREDLVRIVFRGHAQPGVGPISPGNKFWFNAKLQPHPFDQKSAMRRFAQDGFQLRDGVLRDRDGHAVEFSVITNSGNKYREKMATMIQQDLAEVGIKLNVVTLDFPSLIERITRTFDYEACLLGLFNNDLDPNSQMNVWLSSGENHQWNPNQKTPQTEWEGEIDKLMRAQASTLDEKKRKSYIDKVQEIAWEQEPFIYLINRNALSAVSASLHNVHPVVLRPQVYWNIDELSLGGEVAKRQ
jgi:peptide/nickel transport system substrate-binding protein